MPFNSRLDIRLKMRQMRRWFFLGGPHCRASDAQSIHLWDLNGQQPMTSDIVTRLNWCHITCSVHLIQGDGTFNTEGFDSFIQQLKMAECALFDGAVAIT
nr:protein root hair defective 3-like [Tanacetum cinerariifolium]